METKPTNICKLRFWYLSQTTEEKRKYRQFMANSCGIDERTVLRYLEETQAPKLTKHLISDYTKISIENLYKPLEIIQP